MDAILILALFVWVAAWMGVFVFEIGLVQIPLAFWVLTGCVGLVVLWPTIRRMTTVLSAVGRGCSYCPGEHVIYTKQKMGSHPGPHSEDVHPTPHGED